MSTDMSALTSTDRWSRTRLRVTRGAGGSPTVVRSAVSASDPSAPSLRPMLLERRSDHARVCLVPEGALLLAGDGVEIDIEVGQGARLDLVEPGGTVAFDMRGDAARWSVLITLGANACLTWAGEPFVVAAGADVERRTVARVGPGARLALRETLVLGRFGESPGRVRVVTSVVDDHGPLHVEDLPLDATSAAGLLGGHRVMASVLHLGPVPAQDAAAPDPDRYDLHTGGTLWRRLGSEVHTTRLDRVWQESRTAAAPDTGRP